MPTLDQMRTVLAVIDTGSFSAAAKRDRRTQSSVTYAIQTLESRLGVALFDRSGYRPVLTEAGRQLVPRIARVADDVDGLVAQAEGMAGGLEAKVGIVVDAIYPMDRLVGTLADFQQAFPSVPAHLSVEALGGALDMVLKGTADIGVVAHIPQRHAGEIERRPLDAIALTVVAAPGHPLSGAPGPLDADALRDHLQLVLSDRSTLSQGVDFGVMVSRTWRLADLGAKHAMLRAGLGWGGMPLHMVADDIASGRLVELQLSDGTLSEPIHADLVWPRNRAQGPATRWLLQRLQRPPAGAPA